MRFLLFLFLFCLPSLATSWKEVLILLQNKKDIAARKTAIDAMTVLGGKSDQDRLQAIGELTKIAQEPTDKKESIAGFIKSEAITALKQLKGHDAQTIRAVLTEWTQHDNYSAEACEEYLEALDEKAVPELRNLLASSNVRTQTFLLAVLSKHQPTPQKSDVQLLEKFLKSKKWQGEAYLMDIAQNWKTHLGPLVPAIKKRIAVQMAEVDPTKAERIDEAFSSLMSNAFQGRKRSVGWLANTLGYAQPGEKTEKYLIKTLRPQLKSLGNTEEALEYVADAVTVSRYPEDDLRHPHSEAWKRMDEFITYENNQSWKSKMARVPRANLTDKDHYQVAANDVLRDLAKLDTLSRQHFITEISKAAELYPNARYLVEQMVEKVLTSDPDSLLVHFERDEFCAKHVAMIRKWKP